MTDPNELRARAASIFQQLRVQDRPPEDEERPPDEHPTPADQDGPAGALGTEDPEALQALIDAAGGPGTPADEEASESTGDEARTDAAALPADTDPPTPAQPDDPPAAVPDDAAPAANAPPADEAARIDDPAQTAPKPGRHQLDPTTTVESALADLPVLEPLTPVASGDSTPAVEPTNGHDAAPEADPPTEPPTRPTGRAPHPGSSRALPRILAIANQKGGVGKTTTAVNLGASLAELGYRVLVVDLDPQGNATTGLGINARSLESSVYDVILHDIPAEDVIEPTTLRNLFVMPATIDLAGAEIELVPVFSRELRLRRALETVSGDYDFILIDCPPSLGLLTINGLAAAGEVAVPIQCEYYALEGLSQLLRNVNMVRANLNGPLELTTIILTMYDARTRLAEQVVNEVREHFGDRVCRNVVPRTVRLSEAPSYGQPIIVFDASSRGSIAYRELAKEVSGGASQRVG